jgi:prephenate dehydratase
MTNRLAYLGPAGTYSEEAALKYDSGAALVPFSSIPAVVGSIDAGKADLGIVPIENSLEGAVTYTVDLLIHESKLLIRDEVVLPIHHCLMTNPGTRVEDIKVIYSHPQSLAQCRAYLEKRLPYAQPMASLSNSAAVAEMQKSQKTAAAIAGRRAAALYGAELIDKDIEDNSNNVTRFVVLAPTDHAPTGRDKTSLCFDFADDAPGILVSALQEISSRGINLNKIESRPTRKSLGRYIFLVDIDGHREDDIVREALTALKSQVSMLKVLGSYPRQVSSSV